MPRIADEAFAVRLVNSFDHFIARAIGGGRGGKMPSFFLDLNSGRGKTEVEWLNGAVVREGERHGIPAPVNRLLTETLTGLAKDPSLQKEFFEKPGALIRLLEDYRTNSP